MRVRSLPFATALAALLVCGGCKVGPNYKRPEVEMPAGYGELASAPATPPTTSATTSPTTRQSVLTPDPPVLHAWWTSFGDAKLNSLSERALQANHELAIAQSRVREARAIERGVRSALYPTIALGASYFKSLGSSNGVGFPYGIPGESIDLYQLGFDATYEVDLFGGIRRSIEAAGAGADAVEDVRRAVQTTLMGEVSRNYIELRALQRRLEIAHSNLETQQRTVSIVERRFTNGLATQFDQLRARAQLESTSVAIPALEAGIRRAMFALSVLLGEQPMSLVDELSTRTPTPPDPPVVPVGLPSELLRQRPDIRRAERVLAAETAAQGIAVSALFPQLILGGTAGVQSRDFGKLFDDGTPSSGYYLAGPLARWTLFDGGRRRANIDRTDARAQAAFSDYEETVLGALRDVESALTTYRHDQARRETLARVVDDLQKASDIAQRQYDQGLITLLDVLEVQRNLFTSQDALAQAVHDVWSDLVSIYKALGGGWQPADAVAAKAEQKTGEPK
jgi:NodT family efflux transporter outer membrane factor (OMF) lipoprotein